MWVSMWVKYVGALGERGCTQPSMRRHNDVIMTS